MDLELREKFKKRGWKQFLHSFGNSWDGLRYAYRYEQSMTIHAMTVILVISLGIICQISRLEWIICIFLLGIIAATELINTSLEAVIDLICPHIHPLAKIGKDTASAAVFVYSIVSFIVWCLIFIPKLIPMVTSWLM